MPGTPEQEARYLQHDQGSDCHSQDSLDVCVLSQVNGTTERGGVVVSPPSRTRDDKQLSRERAITSRRLKGQWCRRRRAGGPAPGLMAGWLLRLGRVTVPAASLPGQWPWRSESVRVGWRAQRGSCWSHPSRLWSPSSWRVSGSRVRRWTAVTWAYQGCWNTVVKVARQGGAAVCGTVAGFFWCLDLSAARHDRNTAATEVRGVALALGTKPVDLHVT